MNKGVKMPLLMTVLLATGAPAFAQEKQEAGEDSRHKVEQIVEGDDHGIPSADSLMEDIDFGAIYESAKQSALDTKDVLSDINANYDGFLDKAKATAVYGKIKMVISALELIKEQLENKYGQSAAWKFIEKSLDERINEQKENAEAVRSGTAGLSEIEVPEVNLEWFKDTIEKTVEEAKEKIEGSIKKEGEQHGQVRR